MLYSVVTYIVDIAWVLPSPSRQPFYCCACPSTTYYGKAVASYGLGGAFTRPAALATAAGACHKHIHSHHAPYTPTLPRLYCLWMIRRLRLTLRTCGHAYTRSHPTAFPNVSSTNPRVPFFLSYVVTPERQLPSGLHHPRHNGFLAFQVSFSDQ
jgi:hypothetical protein